MTDDAGFRKAQARWDAMEQLEAEPVAYCLDCGHGFLWEDCDDPDTTLCPDCEAALRKSNCEGEDT